MLNNAVIIVHTGASILLILFILLHAGKGGGLSDMFGGGAGGLAGGTSAEKSLDRITVVTALVFAATTFWLAWKWT